MVHADGCHVGRRAKLELLSGAQVAEIHAATLDVLENVGITFHSRRALDILADHGADVDYETHGGQAPGRPCAESARSAARAVHRSAVATPSTTCRSTASTSSSPPTAAASLRASSTAPCAPRASRTSPTQPGSSRRCPTCRRPRPSSRPRTAPRRRACCTSSTPACATRPSTRSSSRSRRTGRRAA